MGGPHIVSFSAPLNKAKYEISINQLGKREISIYTEDGYPAPDAEINIMIDFICLVEIKTYMRGHP